MNALLRPPSRTRARAPVLVMAAAAALTLQASCARSEWSYGDANPGIFSGAEDPAPLTVCIATDCPAPWATCRDGGLCTTDTSRDVENCGGCGNACPKPTPALHATSVCAGGTCLYACDELSADCNQKAADGCEVYTGDDPNNCGGCGITCKAGELCWKGACGCPKGFTRCDTECRNLASDDLACGTCDKKCLAPSHDDPEWKCGPGVQPLDTTWACGASSCKLSCEAWMGDCDNNLCSNGCETNKRTDPLNCGACGQACAANQKCVDGTCLCPPGTTRCDDRCVDVNVDPRNCGECGNGCPGASGDSENGTPTCNGGRCGYRCYAGFADCNGRKSDGCEVNIGNDPLHCGGCGASCDTSRSQPCVLGQCLTKPCDPAPVTF